MGTTPNELEREKLLNQYTALEEQRSTLAMAIGLTTDPFRREELIKQDQELGLKIIEIQIAINKTRGGDP